jgi:hypothetical protein
VTNTFERLVVVLFDFSHWGFLSSFFGAIPLAKARGKVIQDKPKAPAKTAGRGALL